MVGTRKAEKNKNGVKWDGGKTLKIISACLTTLSHGLQNRLTSSNKAAILVVYKLTLFSEASVRLNHFTI